MSQPTCNRSLQISVKIHFGGRSDDWPDWSHQSPATFQGCECCEWTQPGEAPLTSKEQHLAGMPQNQPCGFLLLICVCVQPLCTKSAEPTVPLHIHQTRAHPAWHCWPNCLFSAVSRPIIWEQQPMPGSLNGDVGLVAIEWHRSSIQSQLSYSLLLANH